MQMFCKRNAKALQTSCKHEKEYKNNGRNDLPLSVLYIDSYIRRWRKDDAVSNPDRVVFIRYSWAKFFFQLFHYDHRYIK